MSMNDLAKKKAGIRAECTKQGIDDATRRAIMQSKAGVTSSTELTLKGATAVLTHLQCAGGTRKKYPGAPSTLDREPYLQKIEALLTDMQLPWSYADRIAEHISGGSAAGIKRLAWVKNGKHLQGTVAALMVKKKKLLQATWLRLDAKLKDRGLDGEWCQREVETMGRVANPWPWRECLETLRMLEAMLGFQQEG